MPHGTIDNFKNAYEIKLKENTQLHAKLQILTRLAEQAQEKAAKHIDTLNSQFIRFVEGIYGQVQEHPELKKWVLENAPMRVGKNE